MMPSLQPTRRTLLSLFVPLAFLYWTSKARRTSRPPPTTTTPGETCNPFVAATFCAFAGTVVSAAACSAVADFSEVACPSQSTVCEANFNLTQYCSSTYNGACTADCTRYLDACCETTCCRTSCLAPNLVCQLIHMGRCEQTRAEICPCSTKTQSDQEYCEALVGGGDSGGCLEDCLMFLSSCCNLQNGDLRLVDTSTDLSVDGGTISGRLEVYYQGQWGKVCRDGLDEMNAVVACRQLGYHDKGATVYHDEFSFSGSGLPWFMTSIDCTGDESKLSDCQFPGFGIGACSSSWRDSSITCIMEPPNATQGDVRLVNAIQGDNYVLGAVQVFYEGEWGGICPSYNDGIGWNQAIVACRQLGYSDKGSWSTYFSDYTIIGYGEPTVYDLRCNGKETALVDCDFPGFTRGQCSMTGVLLCLLEPEDGNEGDLRLKNITIDEQRGLVTGRLQVFREGAWGRVCSNYFFSTSTAMVACRQLGYHDRGSFATYLWQSRQGGTVLPTIAPWETRNDPCNGSEPTLLECVRESQAFDDAPSDYCDREVVLGCALRNATDESIGDLRLVDTSQDEFAISGRLQVFNEFWGSLCRLPYYQYGDADDRQTEPFSQVACRELGYFGSNSRISYVAGGLTFPEWETSYTYCNGDEHSLMDCIAPLDGKAECHEISLLWCFKRDPTNTDYAALRLVGLDGGIVSQPDDQVNDGIMVSGRLEVLIHGVWGTICDDSFDSVDASVACRQMGFQSSDASFFLCSNSELCEPGMDVTIWMSNLECTGPEDKLFMCEHALEPDFVCEHWEDVGITCLM